MSKYLTPDAARQELNRLKFTRADIPPVTHVALTALAFDTLEYGVADAAGDIVWFPVDATVGTAEDARQDAVNYAASDQFFRLVCRRVSAPWEVTDE